jgi:chemotaxis protein CheD
MSTTMKVAPILEAGNILTTLPLVEVYLHPGQLYVSSEPAQISMILGSCAGVCLYDCRRSMGGAIHYMLPQWDGSGQPSPRYGDIAIEVLFKQFQILGSNPKDLEAKVFGGACMFQVFRSENDSEDHIGSRNVQMALEILARLGIAVVTRDTGGENGRKLKMQSDTGAVTVSVIRNS